MHLWLKSMTNDFSGERCVLLKDFVLIDNHCLINLDFEAWIFKSNSYWECSWI